MRNVLSFKLLDPRLIAVLSTSFVLFHVSAFTWHFCLPQSFESPLRKVSGFKRTSSVSRNSWFIWNQDPWIDYSCPMLQVTFDGGSFPWRFWYIYIYILDLNVHIYWPLPQLSSDPGPIRLVLPRAWSTATSSTWTVAQGGGISVSNLGSYEQGELSQFQSMNNNDKWEDGDLLDVLDYLMKSKRVRTLAIESYCQRHWFFAMRIV